ncbi:hypothetical protein DL546_001073 [Coniochaeta pulveracea]|uniref:Sin3-associated polypeptide Sap18 n=1 Tax=Coniochaeta pulveracea TaxID=177199 RepID=A0A420Y2X6_9PEZI|nr:hypothetical protein DL546_001073 [Coniochaeta pulveracea]
MDSPDKTPEGEPTTRFLVRLFYRTGAFHRPDEFSTLSHLPEHLQLYTTETSTLLELTHLLAAAVPQSLPSPAIGTRVAFRHVYQDTRLPPSYNASSHTPPPPRFISKDIGSLVIGEHGPGVEDDPDLPVHERTASAENKTLGDVKFVGGDYLNCAILPPVPETGAVASLSSIKVDAGTGRRVVGAGAPLPPPGRRENGAYAEPRGRRDERGGRDWDRNRGPDRDRGFGAVPNGEWRRGERLPEAAPRGGGRRGGGGRW